MPLTDQIVPSFACDRRMTVGMIRHTLARGDEAAKKRVLAWILREATTEDVWEFITPAEAFARLPDVASLLGKRKNFWHYILGKWHDMGKF